LVYSQIWLNLPSDDGHFFYILPMDDLNFGYLLAGGTCCKNLAITIFLRNRAKLRPFYLNFLPQKSLVFGFKTQNHKKFLR
jgi:hypothetical protein